MKNKLRKIVIQRLWNEGYSIQDIADTFQIKRQAVDKMVDKKQRVDYTGFRNKKAEITNQ